MRARRAGGFAQQGVTPGEVGVGVGWIVRGDHAVDQAQVDAEHVAERAEETADSGVAGDQCLGFRLAEEVAEGLGVAGGFGEVTGDPAEAAGEFGLWRGWRGGFGGGRGAGTGMARARVGARLAGFGLDAGEEVVQARHDGAEAPVEQEAERVGETGRGVAHRHDRGGD